MLFPCPVLCFQGAWGSLCPAWLHMAAPQESVMKFPVSVCLPVRHLPPAALALLLILAASGATGSGHSPSAAILAGDDTKIGSGGG